MQKESYGPAWDQVIARLLSEPDDSTVDVEDHLVDLPRQSGMTWMPLPSDDGQPVYGGLDATSGFVVHHVGTAYQVKRLCFGAAASTANAARSAPTTPKAPPAPPRSASRSGESPVTIEVVEARRVHRREADPDTLSPQMNAALVAGMTIAGAALGATQDARKPAAPSGSGPTTEPLPAQSVQRTIPLRVSRPSEPSQGTLGTATQTTPVPISSTPQTSTSGRPPDVQKTSDLRTSLIPASPQVPVAGSVSDTSLSGRQTDVQMSPAPIPVTVERPARSTKLQRKSKPKRKTDLDERGRFRHTVRLDPKTERKLQAVAEILGIDLNAAIAVCISVHQHHRLTKPGGGDG